MGELYSDEFVEELRRGAQSLVADWGLSAQTKVTLLTVSENATFRADDPTRDDPVILRVHRPGYHTRAEIESELHWLNALRAENVVTLPAPIERHDGTLIGGFDIGDDHRDVVAFTFMAGAEPSPDDDLVAGFRQLGEINGRLHNHTKHWPLPEGFVRKRWTYQSTLGDAPLWGDWRDGLGLAPEGEAVLGKACAAIRERLAAYGDTPDKFGLIHADLRLANLLIDEGGRIAVIDFDDCGMGWFMYDFAAAVSFYEHEPNIPDLKAAWVDGYRNVAPLSADDEAMLDTFVMLRRILLTAWIASHSETPTAQEFGSGYTDGSVLLAERYLASGA